MRRTNLVCSIVTQSWCRIFCLVGFSDPAKNKTAQETMECLQHFVPPDQNTRYHSHTDTSLEFTRACEDFCWNHDESNSYQSETNGIAENAVRRVKEGTSALLVQRGLFEKWWEEAMECLCYFCETYKTNWQTESHRMKEDLELHLMVQ